MTRYDVCVQYSGKYAPKKLDLKVTVEHDIKYRRTTNPTLTFNQVILLPYIILGVWNLYYKFSWIILEVDLSAKK